MSNSQSQSSVSPSSLNYAHRIAYGCGAMSILFVACVGIWLYVISNPSRLEKFPQYPNAIELVFKNNSSATEYFEGLPLSRCHTAVVGSEYKAFATKDSEEQVLNYYRPWAKNLQSGNVSEFEGIADSRFFDESTRKSEVIGKTTCFESSEGSRRKPTNVIIFIDLIIPEEARYISTLFPNVPPNMSVVLLARGFLQYG